MFRTMLLGCLATLLCATVSLSAQSQYTPSFRMTRISGPAVNESVSSKALSDQGHVLGTYGLYNRRLFVHSRNDGMVFLDEDLLYPSDVNGSGYAVGKGYPHWIAVKERVYNLPTSGGSGDIFLNDDFQLAGNSSDGGFFLKSFKEGEPVDVGHLGGQQTQVYGLNLHGEVVGTSRAFDGRHYGFVWTARGGMQSLDVTPGPFNKAIAYDINDQGDIVVGNRVQVFIIDGESGEQTLLWVPGGNPQVVAMNNWGQVVGSIGQSGNTEPFFVHNGQGFLLADLIQDLPNNTTGMWVQDINNRGQILLVTRHQGEAGSRTYILTPRRGIWAFE